MMEDINVAKVGGHLVPMRRVPTGIRGLDDLLYGGFLEGDAVLVAGAPGTGKSTLGMQFLYEGIRQYNEPGFFITFEEFPQQIYRDALNYGWDFRALEEEEKLKVLFTAPDLMYQDFKRHEGLFPGMIREIGAKRVVVDSITHFQRLAENPGDLREIIYCLINALKREGLTPLLLRELVEGESAGTVAEEYTADAVVYLTMDRINGQRMRFCEVLKSRGSQHVPAKSQFYISDSGLEVEPPFREAFFRYQEAISTGIPELDSLLGGGIPYGSFYLFEITPELHQEIFELDFIRETVHAEDIYIELATNDTRVEKIRQRAKSYGLLEDIEQGLQAETLRVINLFAEESPDSSAILDEVEGLSPLEDELAVSEQFVQQVVEQLDGIFQQTSRLHRGRLFLDLTRLLTKVDEGVLTAIFSQILDLVQRHNGVCLGFLNPEAIPANTRQQLLSEADGIIRIWKQGNYKYLQVMKTVNSVHTPVYVVTEANTSPFIRLLPY